MKHESIPISVQVLLALALVCFATTAALAQALTAINGSVQDQTGAVIPGADVTVTNTAKGIERKLTSTDAGIFSVPALPPSDGYTVTVSKTGFSKYELKNLTLQVGQVATLNVQLSVAATGTEVSVTGEAPLVEADKTDVSSLVDSNQLLNLPINGRRVDSFVLLGAGVAPDAAFGLLTFRGNPGGNTFLTDGIDTTNSFYDENAGRTRTYNISQDAVQEFQIVTSNFLPEYGRASGGVVNTITRSGTNAVHGSGYWFFRNRTLNATDPTAGGVNPPEWRHQAGASVGGPIKKDKLFYFFNGELQRRSFPIASSNISTTLFNAAGNPSGAIDPATGCGGSTYTTKATAAQCTAAINFLQTRVAPQLVPRTSDVNLMFGKIDYQINDRNRLALELNYLDFRSPNGIQTQGALTNGGAIGNNANTNVFDRTAKAGVTTIIKANAVNEFRFGLFKDRQFDSASPSLFPVTGTASYSISTGNLSNIGVPTAYPRLHPSELRYQLADTIAYTLNRHSLKFGVDYATTEDYDRQLSNQYGTFTFPNINAFALDFSGNTAGTKDYTTYSQKFGNAVWDHWMQDFAFFAQDEIHLTPKFTISPGFRVEHTSLPQPTQVNADYPQTGKIYYKATNFAPRIGLAYAMNNKTVFRAGYGMFHNRYVNQVIEGLFLNNGLYQPSYTLSTAAQIAAGPVFPTYLASVPNVPGAASVAFSTPNFRNSYSQQLQASIQREVAKNTSLTVSYVWSRGLHIVTGYNANTTAPTQNITFNVMDATGSNVVSTFTTPFYTTANKINPNYGTVMALTSDGNSWYNALLIQVNHRYTSWFQAQANYTWSHAIDTNVGGAAGNSGTNGVLNVPSSPTSFINNDIADEKGTSATDQRHRLVINAIVSPTFTHGKSMLDRHLINGWQLSLVSTFASSFAIDSIIGGISGSTLPAAGFGLPTGVSPFATSTINGLGTGSFAVTRVPFQPVDNLNTGTIYRTDARIAKAFSVTEKVKLQLAFEAQNVFNHLIVSGATPRQNVEYNLTRSGSGANTVFKLVPNAAYQVQILQTQAPPDGTTARRAQASIRITF